MAKNRGFADDRVSKSGFAIRGMSKAEVSAAKTLAAEVARSGGGFAQQVRRLRGKFSK